MNHQHTFIEIEGSDSETPFIFTCNRCKEPGTKKWTNYICENRYCNYNIHKQCLLLNEQAIHPFFQFSHFKLYEKIPEGSLYFCDACGKDLLGFSYICRKTGYALHPCCLKLEDKFRFENKTVKLCNEVLLDDCAICNKRKVVREHFQGWSYVIDSSDSGRKLYAHVSCWNDMILKHSEKTRSKGSIRSVMKFTGKIALGMFEASNGDFSSIFTIGEAIFNAFSSDDF